MKKSILFSALLAAGVAFSANAQDFPTPTLYSPLMGVETFSTVCVTWNYENLRAGSEENRMISITTPSGDTFTSKGYTEYVLENDKGGFVNEADPNGENALSASFYSTLISSGYSETGGFTEKGPYTIVIPEGAVTINGEPNPETTLTYNLGYIAYMDEAECEFTDEDGACVLTISWNGQTLKPTRAASNGFLGYLFTGDAEEGTEIFSGSFSFNEDKTALVVTLGKLDEGRYSLNFPGYQLQNAEGAVNPDQNFEFVVGEAGVELITIDGVHDIFNLNGVKVSTTSDLRSLPAGIYVVNGRKVIIK